MTAEKQWATACCEIFLIRGGVERPAMEPDQWRRLAARIAWAWDAADRCLAMQFALDQRCFTAARRMGEAAFNRWFDREQAKVDALLAQLDAVIDRDEWPRALYFGGI